MKKKEIPNEVLLGNVRRLIAEGHTVTIRAKGNSMRPFLEDGRDRIVLAASTRLKKGDVVLAEVHPGHYVLHRVIQKKGDRLVLMGDGNLKGTETCGEADVAAIATSVIRNGKQVDCTGRKWRAYSRLWFLLCPLRRYLLAAYRILAS